MFLTRKELVDHLVFAAIVSAVWATVSVSCVLNQNSFVNLLYFCRICYSFCFAAPFLFSNFSKNFDNLKNNCASASPFSYERFSLIIRHLLCNLSPIILASYYKYRCCNLTWSMLSYSHQDGWATIQDFWIFNGKKCIAKGDIRPFSSSNFLW